MATAAQRTATKPTATPRVVLKRVYAPAGKDDGTRILVDRLWPRGLSTDKARIDLWLRDIAPSDELRAWFGHNAKRWIGFKTRYRAELRGRSDELEPIRQALAHGNVTLLFAAKDEEHNNAVVLKERLEQGLRASAQAKARAGASRGGASRGGVSRGGVSRGGASKARGSRAGRPSADRKE